MTYLKWKLSDGTSGTGPEATIATIGGTVEASWAVDTGGYRIGVVRRRRGAARRHNLRPT